MTQHKAVTLLSLYALMRSTGIAQGAAVTYVISTVGSTVVYYFRYIPEMTMGSCSMMCSQKLCAGLP